MPYAWTHMIYGEVVLIKSNLPQPNHLKQFQLGCQGPDFFFFHRFWPWIKDERGAKLGNLFHTEHCGPVLIDLIDAAKSTPSIRDLVLGFITHHLLDRNTHPYIHYRAGYQKYKHQEFEVILDTLIGKEIKNLETWRTPLAPEIKVGKQLPAEWVETLYQIAGKYYPEIAKHLEPVEYHQAYRDMVKALQLFYDPWGIKNFLTLGQIRPFRHSRRVPDKDFLNMNQAQWCHPAISEEKYDHSFWELWEQALKEGTTILPLVVRYWETGEEKEKIIKLIGNRSYDTGKECSVKLVNQYANPLV